MWTFEFILITFFSSGRRRRIMTMFMLTCLVSVTLIVSFGEQTRHVKIKWISVYEASLPVNYATFLFVVGSFFQEASKMYVECTIINPHNQRTCLFFF